MILYSPEREVFMKAVLDDIWNKLLEIESSNMEIDAKIGEAEREFAELVEKANEGIEVIEEDNNLLENYEGKLDLGNFLGEMDTLNQKYERYSSAKVKFNGIIFGGIIFVILAIPLEFLVLNFGVLGGIIHPMLVPFFNALWRKRQIKEYIDAKRDYIATEENVNERAKTRRLYLKLLDLRNSVKELKNTKEKNSNQLEKLKKKFIKTLEAKMNERYQDAGVKEKVEIQSATITANSANMLRLEFKGNEAKKQG